MEIGDPAYLTSLSQLQPWPTAAHAHHDRTNDEHIMNNDHPHTTVQEPLPEVAGPTTIAPSSSTRMTATHDPPSPTTTVFTDSPAHSATTDATDVDTPPIPSESVMKPLPDTPQLDPHSADPVDLVAPGTSMPPSSRVTSELDDPEVKDLGWRQDSVRAPSLIQGITNDDLFMIVRRFNKVRHACMLCVFFAHIHRVSASATCQGDTGSSAWIP